MTLFIIWISILRTPFPCEYRGLGGVELTPMPLFQSPVAIGNWKKGRREKGQRQALKAEIGTVGSVFSIHSVPTGRTVNPQTSPVSLAFFPRCEAWVPRLALVSSPEHLPLRGYVLTKGSHRCLTWNLHLQLLEDCPPLCRPCGEVHIAFLRGRESPNTKQSTTASPLPKAHVP